MKHPPSSLALPAPEPAALELSHALSQRIAAEIRASGPMSLERFWHWALYAPGLGYYSNGSTKFGAAGDFVTAPELGSVFGRCLARPLAEVLESIGGGWIVEPGGGTGALAATLLNALDALDALPHRYAILEVSGELRARQRETLQRRAPQWLDRVHWLNAPPAEDWRGVLLANEVVDALPARRFRLTADGWVERRVGLSGAALEWVEDPAAGSDAARLEQLTGEAGGAPPVGYQTEYQPHLAAWLDSVSVTLRQGLALFIDYGYPRREYYHPQRTAGTLIAHYRHRAHEDVLALPGLQDLSVSVDFTALAEAAVAAGLDLLGYTTQAEFLIDCGLEQILAEAPSESVARAQLLNEVKVLTLPAEMGDRFQVLAAGRGLPRTPTGFGSDRRERL